MKSTTATNEKISELRRLVEMLRNNISNLCHENARMEMNAARLLRRTAQYLSPEELADYETAFKLRPGWNE